MSSPGDLVTPIALAPREGESFPLEHWALFAFERDLEGSLRRFPMIVRYKLDVCERRIALEDWQRFKREERELLAAHLIGTGAQRDSYRRVLDSLMLARCGKLARRECLDAPVPWMVQDALPTRINDQCSEAAAPQIPVETWKALPGVARFSLYALSRPGHRNRGFLELVQELLALQATAS